MMSRDSTYSSGSFWKGGGGRSYSDSRSRFEDRSGTNDYSSDSRSYQSQPPHPSGGNFGKPGNYSSRDGGSTGSRFSSNFQGSSYKDSGSSRYGGDGSQYNNESNYSKSAPSNYNSGPPKYRSDRSQGYNSSSGPGNYGSGGPNFNDGPPSHPPGPIGDPSLRNSGGYEAAPTENLFSSIQSLSEISKNDFASKILSAVLQTNLMGAAQQGSSFSGQGFMGNQQGSSYDDQMSGYSDRKRYSSRSSRIGGGRAPPPRHSGGPSGGSSRFSRERLQNLRISFPANRSKYDRAFPVRSRNSLSSKRSLSRSTPPRDSKSKRRRSSSRERRESPRIKEENDGSIKKERTGENENDDESSEKKDDIPLAALYCHMCKHGNFTSVKTYLYHLDGVKHKKTAMAFHARNESTLEYLRKNAKLANVRFGGKDIGVPTSKCTVCSAIINESFVKHRKLLEHKLVKKFLSPTCCGRYFKNRYDMNEHRLSLPHLRKIYEANEEKKIFLEDVKAKPGKWNHDDLVKQLMSHNPVPEKHLTLDNIPPFDGNTFIGIKFLRPKESTYCKPCKILIPVGIKSLETHMASLGHYENVMDYLREKRKRRLESGKKEGEEGFSDSDDSDEEKNADDAADSSRFSRNREREDDDDDDDDDEEEAVVVVKGSDDEEEKDDMPFFDETSHIVLEEIGEDMPKQEEGSPKEEEETVEDEEEQVNQEECEQEQNEDQEELNEEPQEVNEEEDEVQENDEQHEVQENDEQQNDENEYIQE